MTAESPPAAAPVPVAQEAVVAPQAPLMQRQPLRTERLPSMGATRGPFAPLPLVSEKGMAELFQIDFKSGIISVMSFEWCSI